MSGGQAGGALAIQAAVLAFCAALSLLASTECATKYERRLQFGIVAFAALAAISAIVGAWCAAAAGVLSS